MENVHEQGSFSRLDSSPQVERGKVWKEIRQVAGLRGDKFKISEVGLNSVVAQIGWLRQFAPHEMLDYIPAFELKIHDDPRYLHERAAIVMEEVKGVPLSKMSPSKIGGGVYKQLAVFLSGCVVMAERTREELGTPIFPDLLGGNQEPHKEFRNFMVSTTKVATEGGRNGGREAAEASEEALEERIYFVDVYPLVGIEDEGLLNRRKKRYLSALEKAGRATESEAVMAAVEELVEAIL